MNIVLDTNVIVSGFLNPCGAPGKIVQMVSSGVLSLCYDARIISEYKKVLHRSKFDFDPVEVVAFLEQVQTDGKVIASEPLKVSLPDPYDESFLEVAISANVQYLVTGNIKHFPLKYRKEVHTVLPSEFLTVYRRSKHA